MTRSELESLGFYRGMQPAAGNVYSSPVGVSNGRVFTPVCEVDLGRRGNQCTVTINGTEADDDPKLTLDDVVAYYKHGLRELADDLYRLGNAVPVRPESGGWSAVRGAPGD